MEIFEKSRSKFHNMVDDPRLNSWALGKKSHDFCPCMLPASGDGEDIEGEGAPAEEVKSQVMNLQAWSYVKTGLAVVGAIVVIRYLYTKFITK
jgi:hypothetical protein